jgi:hypothetical protein
LGTTLIVPSVSSTASFTALMSSMPCSRIAISIRLVSSPREIDAFVVALSASVSSVRG